MFIVNKFHYLQKLKQNQTMAFFIVFFFWFFIVRALFLLLLPNTDCPSQQVEDCV